MGEAGKDPLEVIWASSCPLMGGAGKGPLYDIPLNIHLRRLVIIENARGASSCPLMGGAGKDPLDDIPLKIQLHRSIAVGCT